MEGSPGDVAANLTPSNLPLKRNRPEDNRSLFNILPIHSWLSSSYVSITLKATLSRPKCNEVLHIFCATV